jgi:hypothetical protein
VKAKFENNRYQKPKKKQPESSGKHVDWFWSWQLFSLQYGRVEPDAPEFLVVSSKITRRIRGGT